MPLLIDSVLALSVLAPALLLRFSGRVSPAEADETSLSSLANTAFLTGRISLNEFRSSVEEP